MAISSYQFSPLFLLGFLVPLLVNVGLESLDEGAGILRVQHSHQVVNVAGREAQCLDLGQFRVAGDVGDAVPEIGERVVDGLGSPPLLLVRASDQDRSTATSYSNSTPQ